MAWNRTHGLHHKLSPWRGLQSKHGRSSLAFFSSSLRQIKDSSFFLGSPSVQNLLWDELPNWSCCCQPLERNSYLSRAGLIRWSLSLSLESNARLVMRCETVGDLEYVIDAAKSRRLFIAQGAIIIGRLKCLPDSLDTPVPKQIPNLSNIRTVEYSNGNYWRCWLRVGSQRCLDTSQSEPPFLYRLLSDEVCLR